MAAATATATAPVPVYFEESWAILSSIGLTNVLFGLMVIGITSPSPISLVPIISSAAGAIANGLCYYAFYADYPKTGTLVAAAVADVSWLIQEAGVSFYSYLILVRVLPPRARVVFKSLFWTLITFTTIIRVVILTSRARDISDGSTSLQPLIDHLHIGYFSCIAIVECVSAFFLLRKFANARKTGIEVASTSGLFSYLMRSTEVRLATLALIGFSRAITYSFQTTAQAATTVAGQIDRFVYTLECVYPMVMFIDILASRLVFTNRSNHDSSSQSRSRGLNKSLAGRTGGTGRGDIRLFSMNGIETRVDANGPVNTSQERIVDTATPSQAGTLDAEEEAQMERENKGGGISKTVEFDFRESMV